MAEQAFDDLGKEPGAVHCLCLIGLKSWPTLGWKNQEFWEMSAGRIKGVDCRVDLEQCISITRNALVDLFLKREVARKPGRNSAKSPVSNRSKAEEQAAQPANPDAREKAQERLAENFKDNPIPEDEMERAIAENAIDAYRQGSWLFAIVPDLTHDKATDLLSKAYLKEQKLRSQLRQRARWTDWLPIIAGFEDDEVSHGGAKSQVFTRYRRILDSIYFG